MLSKHVKSTVEDIPDNRILSIEQLKIEAHYKYSVPKDIVDTKHTYHHAVDCYKSLGGYCKSSLDITYYPEEDTWDIYHYIDDSFVVYQSTEHMLKSTNLMKYIKQGYLIKEKE